MRGKGQVMVLNSSVLQFSRSWFCEPWRMPRPGSSRTSGAYNASGGRPHVGLSAEETTGIAILAIIAALVLIIGCWYFKRRNGYKILKTRHFNPAAIRSMMGASRETGECKVPLQDYNTLNNVVPGAPPAYEKIAGETRPPPYTP
ncbi:melanoma antigen recognized by T-cells 1 [Dendrobates tinctorius]|uniref:melanoma antigen recognized by T-cells 1 n=1 Tax=Dendrobates tinctorius TaxID=92724 RepID=UPI003CC92811